MLRAGRKTRRVPQEELEDNWGYGLGNETKGWRIAVKTPQLQRTTSQKVLHSNCSYPHSVVRSYAIFEECAVDEWSTFFLHQKTHRKGLGELLQFKAQAFSDAPLFVREQFDLLVNQWVTDTSISSSAHDICMHPSYQQVIGLGPRVIPLIVEEMLAGGLHWSWALRAITGENPASNSGSPRAATKAWLQWARDHNIVPETSVHP